MGTNLNDEEKMKYKGIYTFIYAKLFTIYIYVITNALTGYLRMTSKIQTAIGQIIEGKIISVTICHECHDVSSYLCIYACTVYVCVCAQNIPA